MSRSNTGPHRPNSSTTNGPSVSVIVPSYNAEATILQAVRSALDQTVDVEVIVIDDGSTDRTVDLITSLGDDRVRVFPTTNRGVASARNRGVELASSSVVAFLDHDDLWLQDKLEKQLSALKDDVVGIGGLMAYIDSIGRYLGLAGEPADQHRIARAELMPFPMSSFLTYRSAIQSVGGFDEALSREVPGGVDDLDLLSRLAAKGRIVTLPQVVGYYRIHAEAVTAKNYYSQLIGTQYLQERIKCNAPLPFDEFYATYRPSLWQRRAQYVRYSYRRAGLLLAERRLVRAIVRTAIAAVLGPRYVSSRLRRQRPSLTGAR